MGPLQSAVRGRSAGVMGVPDTRTPDGFDVQMQTNHLSHFLLTSLLLPAMEDAAGRQLPY